MFEIVGSGNNSRLLLIISSVLILIEVRMVELQIIITTT